MPREAIDQISHIVHNQGMPTTITYSYHHGNEVQDGLDKVKDDDSNISSQPDDESMESSLTLEYDSSDDSSCYADHGSDNDSDGDDGDNLSVPHEQADPVIISEQPGKENDKQEPLLHPNVPE